MVKRLSAMRATRVRSLEGMLLLEGTIPWRRKWQPTPVFLSGESHRHRSLVGYSPWGRKESEASERLHFLFFTFFQQTSFNSQVSRETRLTLQAQKMGPHSGAGALVEARMGASLRRMRTCGAPSALLSGMRTSEPDLRGSPSLERDDTLLPLRLV